MRSNEHVDKYRIRTAQVMAHYGNFGDNYCGVFSIPFEGRDLFCIQSAGEGWEHVSVSVKNRCPNWKEMSFIKRTFWNPEDAVMQLHPPESDYVNCAEHCLHLWRPTDKEIPLPPSMMVGPR